MILRYSFIHSPLRLYISACFLLSPQAENGEGHVVCVFEKIYTSAIRAQCTATYEGICKGINAWQFESCNTTEVFLWDTKM